MVIPYTAYMPIGKTAEPAPKWAKSFLQQRQRLGLTQTQVSDRTFNGELGKNLVAQTTVSDVETGKVNPLSLEALRLIALVNALEFDTDTWPSKELGVLPMFIQDVSPALNPYSDEETEEVEFWGAVSAGNGQSSSKPLGMVRWERDIVHKYRKYGLFVLEVNGTSMYDEDMPYSIPPSSKVLVARQLEPRPSDIIVVWLPERGRDGEGVLKTWKSRNDHVILKSWNRGVAPIVISPEEPYLVQGVVVDVRFSPREAASELLKR